MDIKKAKTIVLEAGKKLIREGLVARTWGNISYRVDEDSFVITPKGRKYEHLTLDDIVWVRISDLSYDGSIKPSSEKGLHAEAYKLSPDVNAVIHTHQTNASIVAAARRTVLIHDDEMKKILGPSVKVGPYALPSTKKLARGTAKALEGGRKATLLANHGVVCIGENMEDAFKAAITLEKVCREFIEQEFLKQSKGVEAFDVHVMHQTYLNNLSRR